MPPEVLQGRWQQRMGQDLPGHTELWGFYPQVMGKPREGLSRQNPDTQT